MEEENFFVYKMSNEQGYFFKIINMSILLETFLPSFHA